ncbi:MAG: hypothetical protein NVSMB64_32600 [Candidatus Velthaea sp.]
MQREMPQRYWKHLPETADIGMMVRDGAADFVARQRESSTEGNIVINRVEPVEVRNSSAHNPVVGGTELQQCRRCDLWRHATQAVGGEGAPRATIMLIGEQPGDEEDLRGHPFVGPAGKVLDRAIAAAGLDRTQLFVTNAVKHFKWEPRGKRRLHKKPGAAEIDACHTWLEHEIATVSPLVCVALGATALRALSGSSLSVEAARRQTLRLPGGIRILATYHPSAILRAEGDRADVLRSLLEADLRTAAEVVSRDPR